MYKFKVQDKDGRGFEFKDNGWVTLWYCDGAATSFSLEELKAVITKAEEKGIIPIERRFSADDVFCGRCNNLVREGIVLDGKIYHDPCADSTKEESIDKRTEALQKLYPEIEEYLIRELIEYDYDFSVLGEPWVIVHRDDDGDLQLFKYQTKAEMLKDLAEWITGIAAEWIAKITTDLDTPWNVEYILNKGKVVIGPGSEISDLNIKVSI